MADNLHGDIIERDRRVELVGNYFLKTGYSTRKLSKLISQDDVNGFKISNATISDYLVRYKEKHIEKADQIDSLIEANKGSSIKNPLDVKRVYKVCELVMKNHSIDEIANIIGATYWTVYYDINIRLKKINKDLYDSVKSTINM